MNVPDRQLLEDVAFRLRTDAALVEKDWFVVRALEILSGMDHGKVTPVFSGGTSLSKGWGLIKRFSEDADFKLGMPASESRSNDRKRRKVYREKVIVALTSTEFALAGDILKGDEDRFFRADLEYPSAFQAGRGLRPHLRIEMTFQDSALPPVGRPIQSLIGQARGTDPEISTFLCVDPVETAADKMSAFAWRVCVRDRSTKNDDPTIVRHLHDLAALTSRVETSEVFKILVKHAVEKDAGRGGGAAPEEASARFALMLHRLSHEEFWADEYRDYVQAVSFAAPDEAITFKAALDALAGLTRLFPSRAT